MPTVLTVWQYFQHVVDQDIILIIDGAFPEGQPSNIAKKLCLLWSKEDSVKHQVSSDTPPALQSKGWRYSIKMGLRLNGNGPKNMDGDLTG